MYYTYIIFDPGDWQEVRQPENIDLCNKGEFNIILFFMLQDKLNERKHTCHALNYKSNSKLAGT